MNRKLIEQEINSSAQAAKATSNDYTANRTINKESRRLSRVWGYITEDRVKGQVAGVNGGKGHARNARQNALRRHINVRD